MEREELRSCPSHPRDLPCVPPKITVQQSAYASPVLGFVEDRPTRHDFPAVTQNEDDVFCFVRVDLRGPLIWESACSTRTSEPGERSQNHGARASNTTPPCPGDAGRSHARMAVARERTLSGGASPLEIPVRMNRPQHSAAGPHARGRPSGRSAHPRGRRAPPGADRRRRSRRSRTASRLRPSCGCTRETTSRRPARPCKTRCRCLRRRTPRL